MFQASYDAATEAIHAVSEKRFPVLRADSRTNLPNCLTSAKSDTCQMIKMHLSSNYEIVFKNLAYTSCCNMDMLQRVSQTMATILNKQPNGPIGIVISPLTGPWGKVDDPEAIRQNQFDIEKLCNKPPLRLAAKYGTTSFDYKLQQALIDL